MARETHILPILAHRLFSPPHISRKLTIFSVLCIIVDIFLILIRQPAKYWISYKYAESDWFSPLLAVHPLFFVGAVLIGLLIVLLLLDGLAFIPAFILWVIVIFSQIYYIAFTTLWILYNHKLGLNRSEQEITVLVLSLVISGAMGFIVTRTSFIDARPQAETGIPARANKKRLARVILISGTTILFLLLSFGLYRSIKAPISRWQLIKTRHAPEPREDAAIAYDTERGRAVLFGGAYYWSGELWDYKNDTWEWDGKDWTQMVTDVQPTPRSGFDMAYDPVRKYVVLFGGRSNADYYQDTWIWDGEKWTEAHPISSPSARVNHKMVYDPQRQMIVLYGGYDGNTFFNDGWEWDGANWQAIQFDTVTPPASGFFMFYDQAQGQIVALLAWDGTWIWNGASWLKLYSSVMPGTSGLPVAYDPIHQSAVIFIGNLNDQFTHQTWIYKNMDWEKLDPPYEPTMRWGHSSFYDPVRKRVIIFGGFDGANYLNDMWEFVLVDGK